MNKHKKVLFGLGFLAFLGLLLVGLPQKALAANENEAQRCANTLEFVSIAEIKCFPVDGQPPVRFIDSNPTDSEDSDRQYAPIDNFFCGDESVFASPYSRGIFIESPDRNLNRSDAGKPVKVGLRIGYSNAQASCIPYGGADGLDVNIPGNRTQEIKNFLRFSGTAVESLELVSGGSLGGKSYDLTPYSGGSPGGGTLLVFTSGYAPGGCSGEVLIVNVSGGVNAVRYQLKSGSGGVADATLAAFLLKNNSTCEINAGATNFGLGGSFGVLGTPPSLDDVPDDQPVGIGADEKSCEKSFSSVFAFFMCPALRELDDAAGGLFGIVEDQLCLKTGDTSSTAGPPCKGKNILTEQMEQSWTIFRTIATALLVIIMLVMIFSQAVSIGPVDAYTLRKLLPRMVAAVILIQISWVMLKFFVDLSNDLGRGVATLMFAPFGGIENMNLADMVGNGFEQSGIGGNVGFELFAGLAAIGAGLANLPGLLALAFFVVFSLFVAFFVLVLRQLLIVLLVLVVPLALIFWILPRTENYWRVWYSNFSKLLLMFPLIMAMIASGRIVAYVASNPAVIFKPPIGVAEMGPIRVPFADVEGFVGLAVVLIAFFAPYLLIFKTFSWGGQLMGLASRTITQSNAAKNFQDKGDKAFRGWAERKQGKWAKAYNPNATLFGSKKLGMVKRGYRRVQSGHYLPTERSRRLTTLKGDRWAAERNEEADAYVARIGEKAQSGYNRADHKVLEDGSVQWLKYERNKAGKYKKGDSWVDNKDDADFEVVKDRRKASKETLKGVEAIKQAWIDIGGNDGTSDHSQRAAQSAIKRLAETSSEIEFQNARIQGGKNEGLRVTEVGKFKDTMENTPEMYSRFARTRPDETADVIEGAEKDVGMTYQKAHSTLSGTARAEKIRELDSKRIETTIERMTAETLQNAHFGLYEDIAKVGDINIEVKNPVTGDKETKTAAEHFAARLEHIYNNGGLTGQNAVGSLTGGRERYVNKALERTGKKLGDITTPRRGGP